MRNLIVDAATQEGVHRKPSHISMDLPDFVPRCCCTLLTKTRG